MRRRSRPGSKTSPTTARRASTSPCSPRPGAPRARPGRARRRQRARHRARRIAGAAAGDDGARDRLRRRRARRVALRSRSTGWRTSRRLSRRGRRRRRRTRHRAGGGRARLRAGVVRQSRLGRDAARRGRANRRRRNSSPRLSPTPRRHGGASLARGSRKLWRLRVPLRDRGDETRDPVFEAVSLMSRQTTAARRRRRPGRLRQDGADGAALQAAARHL